MPVLILGIHCVMIIINMKEKTITHYDPMHDKDTGVVRDVRKLALDEIKHNLPQYPELGVGIPTWQVFEGFNFPKQRECSSCGVFILWLAEF